VTKEQVDLANSVLWIPDSKTPTVLPSFHLPQWPSRRSGTRSHSQEAAIIFFLARKARPAINAPTNGLAIDVEKSEGSVLSKSTICVPRMPRG